MSTFHRTDIAKLRSALPFWLSLGLLPLVPLAAIKGGVWLFAPPLYSWGLFGLLDEIIDKDTQNADPETDRRELYWYRFITLIWFPLQFVAVFSTIAYVTHTDHLAVWEKFSLFFGIGVLSGTVGINYSHELMHQRSRYERWIADLLLASVLYSHFRSEHLLVHHRYVGTPRDAVTARYNENFYLFFPRVLYQSLISAWHVEKQMLARKKLPPFHHTNPFWRYWALQGFMILLAFTLGGGMGLCLFIFQGFIAIWQLELVSYVEHYGLTRKHLGDGKYEHVAPRHSWNASQKASNWLLINLQRHSDHHYKPNRPFPLLQNHTEEDAPQLPYGYPTMTMLAMIPNVFRRMMNPRVRKWRAMHYPEITDWAPYKTASNPMPK